MFFAETLSLRLVRIDDSVELRPKAFEILGGKHQKEFHPSTLAQGAGGISDLLVFTVHKIADETRCRLPGNFAFSPAIGTDLKVVGLGVLSDQLFRPGARRLPRFRFELVQTLHSQSAIG